MATDTGPKRLGTPLDSETVASLRVGDELFIDGVIWGVRDATLIRFFDEGRRVPADLRGGIFLHTAPSVRRRPDSGYDPVSVGTTTSMRMDRFTRSCLAELGIAAIVGKGGLSDESSAAFREHNGVYLSIVGGAASVQTEQIEQIEDVFWPDLMPECLWKFRVRDFGPLFVTMDSTGASSYRMVGEQAEARLAAAYRALGIEVSDE
jgi:L(+)-tartrate dehydratase beta subunit